MLHIKNISLLCVCMSYIFLNIKHSMDKDKAYHPNSHRTETMRETNHLSQVFEKLLEMIPKWKRILAVN